MKANITMTEEMAKLIKQITKLHLVRKDDKEEELDTIASRLACAQKELTDLELRDRYFFNNRGSTPQNSRPYDKLNCQIPPHHPH